MVYFYHLSTYDKLSKQAIENERRRKKQYKRDHPEIVSAINKRVYAKRKNVIMEATSAETKAYVESNTECILCGSSEDLTLDHIIPVSWGAMSRHSLDNFQILCNVCNSTKSNKYSIDFRPIEPCMGFDLREMV